MPPPAARQPPPAAPPADHASQAGASARHQIFDVLRGAFLLLIALNHVPSPLGFLTQQPLGFATAAEGFVLLAGLLVGLLYTRRFTRLGKAASTNLLVRRAGVVYLAHVACLAGVIGWMLVYAWLSGTGRPPVASPWIFFDRPVAAPLAALGLLLQPGLLDVLPMYAALLLITPMVLRQLMRGRLPGVLIGSGLCWGFTNLAIPTQPIVIGLVDTSAFNFGAWQLLYILGLVAGHLAATAPAASAHQPASVAPAREASHPLLRPSRGLVAAAFAVALLLALARHGILTWGQAPELWERWSNKNNLAPLRLLDVAALAVLLRAWLVRRTATGRAEPRCPPLALLGRHSLAVFSVHVVVAHLILGLPWWFEARPWGPIAGPVLLLGAIFAAAAAAERLAASRRRALASAA